MTETRTVHDPFHGKNVEISNKLTDRLRGRYASGPHLPNGNPEFGWRQFQAPPIQHEAAERIEALEAFVLEVENIETAWVTGTTSAQESMIALHESWRSIRAKMKQV